jgi:hypothetical protein
VNWAGSRFSVSIRSLHVLAPIRRICLLVCHSAVGWSPNVDVYNLLTVSVKGKKSHFFSSSLASLSWINSQWRRLTHTRALSASKINTIIMSPVFCLTMDSFWCYWVLLITVVYSLGYIHIDFACTCTQRLMTCVSHWRTDWCRVCSVRAGHGIEATRSRHGRFHWFSFRYCSLGSNRRGWFSKS